MKQIIIIFLSCAAFVTVVQASPFLDAVDIAWRAKDDSKVLRLANEQIQDGSNVLEAQAVLFKYNLLVAGDRQQAIQILDQIINKLSSINPSAVPNVSRYRNDLLQSAGGNLTAATPTVQQLQALHHLFPSGFPIRSFLVLMSGGS